MKVSHARCWLLSTLVGAVLLAASPTPVALAAPGDVSRLGPDGSDAELLVIGPDGRTIWLGGDSSAPGLFVSGDGGRRFARTEPAAPCWPLDDIGVHPEDPAVAWILCGGELFETTDRGGGWHSVPVAAPSSFYRWIQVAVLPDATLFVTRRDRVQRMDSAGGTGVLEGTIHHVAGGPDGSVWALTERALLRSRDRGDSWELTSQTERIPWGWVVVDPSDAERVLRWGTGNRLERSDDGGRTFDRVGKPLEYLSPLRFGRGGTLLASWLVERGRRPGAATSRLSRNLGEGWRPVPRLPANSLGVFAVDPRWPRRIAWAASAATGLGVDVSDDSGRTWKHRGAGLDGLAVMELAFDASGGGAWAVLRGRFGGRMYELSGSGWRRASLHDGLVEVDSVTTDARDPRTAWAATNLGLVTTDDGGEHWRPVFETDVRFRAQLRAHPTISGVLFLVEQPSTYPAETLMRSVDGGKSFTDTRFRLDGIRRLVASPTTPGRLGLAGFRCSGSRSCVGPGIAAESTDDGRTWFRLGVPPRGVVGFVWSPGDLTSPGIDRPLVATNRGLFRREDPSSGFSRLDRRHYLDLVAGERTLYALVRTSGRLVRLRASDDAGERWRNLGESFTLVDAPDRLEVIPGEPDRLFAFGPKGVLQIAVEHLGPVHSSRSAGLASFLLPEP